MKKILLLIVLCLLVAVPVDAQRGKRTKKAKAATTATYKVEKASEVYCDGSQVQEGAALSGNSTVEVKSNGYLMIVNTSAKRRYYISKAVKARVADVVKEVTKPKSVSKAYLESLMTKKQRDTYSNSYGNVERRPTPINFNGIETNKNGEIELYIIEDEKK